MSFKILHVGNGNYKHLGQRYYDVGRKLNNGLIRNGHDVMFFSDRDTARTSNIFHSSKFGFKQCNQKLIQTALNFQPDFMLLGHADIITNETLTLIREKLPRLKIAQFNVDILFCPENAERIKRKLPLVDASFITTGGEILEHFSLQGRNFATFIPNPVDSSIETARCHECDDQEYDLFYAIRPSKWSFSGDERIETPKYISQHYPELRTAFFGCNNKPAIFGSDYFKMIANSKMGLNISVTTPKLGVRQATKQEKYLYSSDRIAQYIGSGLLTFVQEGNALEELYSENEVVYFSSPEDLCEKLKYFKNHDDERKQIAANGWRKAHEYYNERLVAAYIVEATFGLPHSHQYIWPTEKY